MSALAIMREAGVTELPVIDDDRFVGIISEKDIFHSVPLIGAEPFGAAPNLPILSVMRVAGVMSYAPATVDDTTPLPEALSLMAHSGASALPVLHQGRLVGVFTVPNALRAALEIVRIARAEPEEETNE